MPSSSFRVYLCAYLSVFIGAFVANGAVVTQTHTLYYVEEPTNTATFQSFEIHETNDFKPIATLDGGSVTRYEQVNVQSVVVLHTAADASPATLLSEPLTRTVTFDQGSATYRQSIPAATQTLSGGPVLILNTNENCSLDIGQKSGSCVRVQEVPPDTPADQSAASRPLETTTWTGPLVPFATITSTVTTSGSVYTSPVIVGIATSLLAVLSGGLLL